MRIGKYVIGFAGSERVKRFSERNRAVEGFALVAAIDGRSLPWSLVRQAFSRSFVEHQLKVKSAPWLHGTLGCLLSHCKAMEQALRDEVDFALIAEDDALFRASPDVFFGVANSGAYDVVYLNDRMSPGQRQCSAPHAIERLSAANIKGTGAEAYVLSRRAMQVLLEQFASALRDGMPCGYDGFLQSAALVKGDAIEKAGGKSMLRWTEYREGDLKVGVALPTLVAHCDEGVSLICN